jgi:hypothetical protein
MGSPPSWWKYGVPREKFASEKRLGYGPTGYRPRAAQRLIPKINDERLTTEHEIYVSADNDTGINP